MASAGGETLQSCINSNASKILDFPAPLGPTKTLNGLGLEIETSQIDLYPCIFIPLMNISQFQCIFPKNHINTPVSPTLNIDKGINTFHPKFINWSNRKRGIVQRTHMKKKMKKKIFEKRNTIPKMASKL